MCFHRRLVYTCSHHVWLQITRPCAAEESFHRGEADTGCCVRWSHGFDTVRVQIPCPACVAQQTVHTSRLGAVKDQIRALKEQLKTMKGPEAVKGDEWLGGEGGLEGRGVAAAVVVANETGNDEAVLSGSEQTDEPLIEEEGCLDATMEEVRVDPKHWPFKLPFVIAERRREQAEVEMGAQSE